MPSDLSSPPAAPPAVLFVDDDADVRGSAAMLLGRHGFRLLQAGGPAEAWAALAAEPVDVVLLDLNFDRGSTTGAEGLAFLKALVAHDPDAVAVVVTGHSGINIAVAAMRAGAADFVMKPWSNDRLVATLRDAASLRRRRAGRQHAPPAADERPAAPSGEARSAPAAEQPVIGDSAALRRVLDVMRRAAPTDAPVLLSGEPGVGKTLLAYAIHRASPRRDRPLVTLDPAAAWAQGEAAFDAALAGADPGGTLVLDEIAGLPAAAQARLTAAPPGPRLVATTRRSREALRDAVQPDLLHRLNTVELALPPLRARPGDPLLLAEHYLRLFARRYGRPGLSLAPEAADAVAAHAWPGNVRELRLAVERAAVLAAGDVVRADEIPLAAPHADDVAAPVPGAGDLNLARSERAVVEAALRRHAFNVSHAARELGLTRAALYRRMARHGL